MKISAVIITKNESEDIERCLKAIQQVVDEVIVVDSMSEDDTVEICKQAGAKVFQTTWKGYAQTKNYANSLATHDWILSVDADEVLSPALIQSIQNLQIQEKHIYFLDRICNFCGDWIHHSGWYPDWKPRLFNRTTSSWIGDFVHENLTFPKASKSIYIPGKLFHYSYKTKKDHAARIEKYTQLAADEMFAKGKTAPSFIMIGVKQIARFIRTFIIKKGILDGKNGWYISIQNAKLVRLKYLKLKALHEKARL